MYIYIYISIYFSHSANYPTGWRGPTHVDAGVLMHCKITFSEGISSRLLSDCHTQ